MNTKYCIALFLMTLNLSCGSFSISNGGSNQLNDDRPTGIVLKQGQFFGASGQSVSGTAIIFLTSGSNYTLRLEGFTAPSESGMKIQINANIGTVPQINLRATSGNQNYTFSATTNSFTQVQIVSTQSIPTGQVYGNANVN